MTDLNTLLQTYIERFESGESTDPTDLLDQAEGRDRARLSALIDGYLEHAAPAQEWDSAAFEGSVAARAAGMVEDAWAAESAALPRELVALRKRAELPRRSLVERLADTLGFPEETERVSVYYNAMEHGWLNFRRVSPRVYDALGTIFGTSAEALRKAGEAVTPSAGGEPGAVYARAHWPTLAPDEEAAAPGRAQEASALPSEPEPDELDRLFIGAD